MASQPYKPVKFHWISTVIACFYYKSLISSSHIGWIRHANNDNDNDGPTPTSNQVTPILELHQCFYLDGPLSTNRAKLGLGSHWATFQLLAQT